MEWRNVTDTFTEDQRYFRDTYLEIDEVLDEKIEVSLFSSMSGPYEIYVSYGWMYGIIYSDKEHAYEKREEVKRVIAEDYLVHGNPSDEFCDMFQKKYGLELPLDIFF